MGLLSLSCFSPGVLERGSARLEILGATPARAETITYQGFGATTPGGSQGAVYHVTSLADSGTGTLRDALSRGSRTVVFDVGGEIVLSTELRVRGAFVTVDGLSAPSPGITLKNAGVRISGSAIHDVIIRGIRIRNPAADGITIKDNAYNIVLDHLSIDACGDGNIDITQGAHDVTVSWSILSGCPKNVLIKYGARHVTMHHNLLVESRFRNPWVSHFDDGTPAVELTADLRNNLVWDWGVGAGTGVECGATANVVENFYSSPASSPNDQDEAIIVKGADAPCGGAGRAYTSGNVSGDDLAIDVNSVGNEPSAFVAATVDTTGACQAAFHVLAGAGAPPLDASDQARVSRVSLASCLVE